ncbi:TetR/AcrR family transcriptional regulator [Tunicatimonas pelagia]|uniref:TetR/AcrR family transcriptional regulator n=1 Tax=Tunicatimonas pelagia TaxID=931531 RepID=UPI00266546EA|nr:TetR/AcrR family transcriptional regulator [Tunicatimonas pelagia]WKN43357.1 TetR/AcrR family transcriptional regulator [Tunicatimonas pelagia]
MESKEQIANAAEQLFLKYGVRSVTMDDIAKQLGISKKTIYQYFADKDEVVELATLRILEREKKLLAEVQERSENAIHELYLFTRYIRQHIVEVNPSILFDIQKYHRGAWKIYQDFKGSVFLQTIESSIRKGMEEGHFRADIKPEILAKLRIEQVNLAFNNEIFPKHEFDWTEVHLQIFYNFCYGLLTTEGVELFEKYAKTLTTHATKN